MPAIRAVPWARIILFARVVLARFGEDVSAKDRRRLTELVRRSKGDPRTLTKAERSELVRIVRQVDLARLSREIAALGAGGRLLRR